MFKKVTEDAILPTRGSKYAACVDVYSNEDVVIGAGETKVFGLGIAINNNFLPSTMEIKSRLLGDDRKITLELFHIKHYLQLSLRSSLGKKGLIMPHGVGIVDLDYKDEIKIIIHNPIKQRNKYLKIDNEFCPKCGEYKIDDDDGVNLDKDNGVVLCRNCNTEFIYTKNFKEVGKDFPYTEWIDTTYEETNTYFIKKGDKISQITLLEHKSYLFNIYANEERVGGFGSTGER